MGNHILYIYIYIGAVAYGYQNNKIIITQKEEEKTQQYNDSNLQSSFSGEFCFLFHNIEYFFNYLVNF